MVTQVVGAVIGWFELIRPFISSNIVQINVRDLSKNGIELIICRRKNQNARYLPSKCDAWTLSVSCGCRRYKRVTDLIRLSMAASMIFRRNHAPTTCGRRTPMFALFPWTSSQCRNSNLCRRNLSEKFKRLQQKGAEDPRIETYLQIAGTVIIVWSEFSSHHTDCVLG